MPLHATETGISFGWNEDFYYLFSPGFLFKLQAEGRLLEGEAKSKGKLLLSLFLCRNKSKLFTSRLADQRARLVVMLRRGDLPEELENEKIVELQLQKKQVRFKLQLFWFENSVESLIYEAVEAVLC